MNNVHIIAHTHWDREWYQSSDVFRFRLVEMVDELIDRLSDQKLPEFPAFHLDGQTVLLEDYLEIRPDKEGIIKDLVKQGRLLIGPWYCQPDETLVSGEALIRNLQIGLEMSRDFGGGMSVGYVPDIFGHISQLPQILTGFGIDNAFVWRGMVTPKDGQPKTEFWWESPDGSRVIGFYLVVSGYFTAPHIGSLSDMESVLAELQKRSLSGELLVMNGADHFHVQPDLPQAIASLSKEIGDQAALKISTLPAFVQAVRKTITADSCTSQSTTQSKLTVLTGELRQTRCSPEGLFLLYGTLSARMPLKQANFRAQRLLERVVEPMMLHTRSDRQLWVKRAWKELLKNHAHDSICGCSIDRVANDMMTRFGTVEDIGDTLIHHTLVSITKQPQRIIPDDQGVMSKPAAQYTSAPVSIPILIHNAAAVTLDGVVQAKISLPEGMVPQTWIRATQGMPFPLAVVNQDGRKAPVQVISVEKEVTVEYFQRQVPHWQTPWVATVCLQLPESVPPLGNAELRVEQSSIRSSEAVTVTKSSSQSVMDNGLLVCTVAEDGAVSLLHMETGQVYRDLLTLEDGGDLGDLYNYSPPLRDEMRLTGSNTVQSVEVLQTGPLIGHIRIHHTLSVPKALNSSRTHRSSAHVEIPITVDLRLSAESEYLSVRVSLDNRAHDHRIRLLVNTPLFTATSYAQSAFTVDKRPVITGPVPVEYWREDQPNLHPQKEWMGIGNDSLGIAVLNKGLPEYQVIPAGDGNKLAITLLRSVGNIHSRDSLTIDRRDWGIPKQVPDAQCLGEQEFELAIMPYAGAWDEAEVDHQAEQFAFGAQAYQLQSELREPQSNIIQSITPRGVHLTSLKRAEDGGGVIARLFNNRANQQTVTLQLSREVSSVLQTDLLEQATSRLKLEKSEDGSTVQFDIGPWEIITLKLLGSEKAYGR